MFALCENENLFSQFGLYHKLVYTCIKLYAMSQEKALSPEESLKIAQEMMGLTRKSFADNSFYFLLWGWLLLFAGLGEYILSAQNFEHPYMVWGIVGFTGGIISSIKGARENKKANVATVTDRCVSGVWMAFIITLFALLISLVANQNPPNSIVILITGLHTFATGYMLRFNPLIIGGILFWAIGIASFFVPIQYSSLFYSAAILVGYLVPGYLLKSAEKNGSV